MRPLVTIGITSYKRVDELIRCINSIETKYAEDIEILVSEDKSPLSEKIKDVVEKMAQQSRFHICFTTNDYNLGYDMNLGAIIKKSKGQFVFFMSDDDALASECLDDIIDYLRNDNIHGVFYAPFIYSGSGEADRVRGNSKDIERGEENATKFLYDSILFSGLIFRKEYVEKYDASRFKNLNYFQVYLFLQMIFHYGAHYFEKPSVVCIGDGENAYGISESSGGNELLANRKSVQSNLEFNKTLIKVIKMFDEDEGTNILKGFEKQYSIHSYSGLSIARNEGKTYYKNYWMLLNSLEIRLYPITKVYYYSLLVFGSKNLNKLAGKIKCIYKKRR